MRLRQYDKMKSQAQIRLDVGKVCCVDGCGKSLTPYKGPGQDKLCRGHQIEDIKYGGYGKLAKTHTYHRSDVCECCGQDINDDPRWEKATEFFGVVLTESQIHEIKRRYNHADHDFRAADGGDNSAENINAFCSFCHWFKTVIKNDGRKGTLDKLNVDKT
jgi:hypothetical protein